MKFGFSDLTDNTGHKSSMRFNVRLLAIMTAILILCIAFYIVIRAFGDGISGGEWAGIGGFFTSLAIFVGALLYNQQQQKKSELECENREIRI